MKTEVYKYLRALDIKITPSHCEKLILCHPDYPGLTSIVDLIESVGVNTAVLKTHENEINQLPFPYLFHSKKIKNSLYLIKDKEDLVINGCTQVSGVAVLPVSVDKVFDKKRENDWILYNIRNIFLYSSVLIIPLLFISIFLNAYIILDLPQVLLILTSIVGLVISSSLLLKDLGIDFAPVEKFCTSNGVSDCDKILDSPAATIFKVVKLSDISLSYFLTQILTATLICVLKSQHFLIYSAFGAVVLAAPVIVFSLYYQYFVANTWCKLCLLIVSVILMQNVLAFARFREFFLNFNIVIFSASSLLFIVVLSVTILIKNAYVSYRVMFYNECAASRIKYSVNVFRGLMSNTVKIAKNRFEQELFMGNENASIVITVVSNLFCGPCKRKQIDIQRLLDTYPDKIRVDYRFVHTNPKNSAINPVQYLLEYWIHNILGKANQDIHTGKMLKDWYDIMDLDKFKINYPLSYDHNKLTSNKLSDMHSAWVNAVNVTKTPTMFFNNYELIDSYSVDDLRYMIPGLCEYFDREKV